MLDFSLDNSPLYQRLAAAASKGKKTILGWTDAVYDFIVVRPSEVIVDFSQRRLGRKLLAYEKSESPEQKARLARFNAKVLDTFAA
jgi:hypothetical protein